MGVYLPPGYPWSPLSTEAESSLANALAPKSGLGLLSGLTSPQLPPPNYTNALSGFGSGLSGFGSLASNSPTFSNALSAFASFVPPPVPMTAPAVLQWCYVRQRFNQFLANLNITVAQAEDGETKHAGVRACLNRRYWNSSSETDNSMLIGSWGKLTRRRPSSDVDILFLLPAAEYHRFDKRSGNRQSQLLQEIRDVLAQTYSQTRIRGDGQVVVVPFNTIPVEVSPGFRCQDGSIIVCDTNDGGRYITSTAEAEARDLAASDARSNGNTRALARMMKQWQVEANVPLKSFHFERLAVEFLQSWQYSHHDAFWYDWMIRDFFAYLVGRANGQLIMPGTGEVISLGSEWLNRAQRAYSHAVNACEHERDNYQALAGDKWQAIFGSAIPVVVA
jgi:hypothetical protein